MDEHEQEFLRRTVQNLATSMAIELRSGFPNHQVIEDRERLTPAGRMWVQGFLTCRLSMLRGNTTGAPTLSDGDLEQIASLVEQKEKQIAAEVYS